MDNNDSIIIKKLKLLKNRKNQKIIVEMLLFISIIFKSYHLFSIALISWLIYLLIAIPKYWEKSKFVFFAYFIVSIIVIYLLTASISGIIKFWKLQ